MPGLTPGSGEPWGKGMALAKAGHWPCPVPDGKKGIQSHVRRWADRLGRREGWGYRGHSCVVEPEARREAEGKVVFQAPPCPSVRAAES